MRKLIYIILFIPFLASAQIVADHNAVDEFGDIPSNWIDSVKTKWVSFPGESHAAGLLVGLDSLEGRDGTYAVDTKDYVEAGTPDAYTTDNLRASTAMWGDYTSPTGWSYLHEEGDWWTNSSAIARVKTSLSYCNNTGPSLFAIGFGWCWDATRGDSTAGTDPVTGNRWYGQSFLGPDGSLPWGIDDTDNSVTGNSVNMDTYIDATQAFIDYCADSIPTHIFFTTGPVDQNWDEGTISKEALYQGYLKWEHLRDYVALDEDAVLFDYADILCYDDGESSPNTTTWDGNEFPAITANNADQDIYHLSYDGHVRLAKAMWWMLARLAGWEGVVSETTARYVSPRGNDSNAGTDSSSTGAWLTWNKAFDEADVGDTVYFMGGTYDNSGQDTYPVHAPYDGHGNNGNADTLICFFNYPGQTPILDCSGQTSVSSNPSGMKLKESQFLHFKGLHIKNLWQRESTKIAIGINCLEGAYNITWENMDVSYISGRGMMITSMVGYEEDFTTDTIKQDSSYFINCDFHHLCDSLTYGATEPDYGNAADGIKATINPRDTAIYPPAYWHFRGCRAYYYTDDGFDIGGWGRVIYDSCWVYPGNIYDDIPDIEVEGNGIKSGGLQDPIVLTDTTITTPWRVYRNNIVVGATTQGYYDLAYGYPEGLLNSYYQTRAVYYNNVAYQCKIGFTTNNWASWRTRKTVYRNNIAYKGYDVSGGYAILAIYPSIYPESHNTWDATQDSSWPGWYETDSVTVTNADFISLDSIQLIGARQADGSLPEITFLHLSPKSDLIDAGTQPFDDDNADFELIYYGDAPDIGAFEYNPGSATRPRVIAF
jgi:hypothetical protein